MNERYRLLNEWERKLKYKEIKLMPQDYPNFAKEMTAYRYAKNSSYGAFGNKECPICDFF